MTFVEHVAQDMKYAWRGMRARPAFTAVVVATLGLGVGVNLLSSVVFFVMLEAYWQRMKRANGKEVGGFDYLKFARNVSRSRQVRILGTFIYPLTEHPAHAEDRAAVLAALRETLARPSVAGVQLLFLDPSSSAASIVQRKRRATRAG